MAKKYVEKEQFQEHIDKIKEKLALKVDKADKPYKPGGTIAFADLPEANEANAGYVYNINEPFTTTADFVEGADIEVDAGTDIAIIMIPPVAPATDPTYAYNLFGGSGKIEDVTSAELAEMWKDAGILTLSAYTATIATVGDTETITVDDASGAVTVASSDDAVATASITGTTITITSVAAGTATITVTSAATDDNRKVEKEIAVTCS